MATAQGFRLQVQGGEFRFPIKVSGASKHPMADPSDIPVVDVDDEDMEESPELNEGGLAGASKHTSVVKRERSASPRREMEAARGTGGDADFDPDKRLDAMIRAHESEPAWMQSFQRHIGGQIGQLTEAVVSFQHNLTSMNSRLSVLESRSATPDPRVDALAQQVGELRRLIQANPGEDVTRERTHTQHGPERRPQHVLSPDTDYNHILCGGWQSDVLRSVVEGDTLTFTRGWQPRHTQAIDRVVVFGRRPRTSHVHLHVLPHEEAKKRFFELRDLYNETATCSSGSMIWMTASKTMERRLKNRATKKAQTCITELCSASSDMRDSMDCDWARQIIWVRDARVAAGSLKALNRDPGDTTVLRTFRGEDDESLTFHFNLTALSKLLGAPEKDIEVKVQSD